MFFCANVFHSTRQVLSLFSHELNCMVEYLSSKFQSIMNKASFLILTLFLLFCTSPLWGQVSESSDLYQAILKADSLLFNVGFNTCDISQFEHLISEDFEFYHDQAGITDSKVAFITSIKDGLCALPYTPRRELDAESVQVYPLKENGLLYGAIQSGTHSFYAREAEIPEYRTSIAQFTHVWMLEDGEWKLARGLSYDHTDVNGDE